MNEQEHTAYWRGYNDAKEAIKSDQQRTWVGLTLDDVPDIYLGDLAFGHGVKWAEAKLKELNT